MELFFCPACRWPATCLGDRCPVCGSPCDDEAHTYTESLLQTVLSRDTSRAGMAVDVLTKWLREPRAVVPLLALLERSGDPYPLVLGARGLGWLADPQAVPALADLLLDESKPFVARVAAAEALGQIGGPAAFRALQQAAGSRRRSVVEASARALKKFQEV